MNFDMSVDSEKKLNSLYMIDILLIYKLVEQFTKEKLPNNLLYYWNLRSDYMSYEDLWFPLEIFLDHTEIGSLDYEEEYFRLTISSIQEVWERKESLSEDKQIDFDNFIEKLCEDMQSVSKNPDTVITLLAALNEDNGQFEGALEFGNLEWYSICEFFLKAHYTCLELFKEDK